VRVQVNAETVRALRDKYREIKRLRDADAAGSIADPRREMAALAQRFPGALRELDELPMDQIEARLFALEQLSASADAHAAPEWVRLQIGYHGCMRAVLRIKRIAAGVGDDVAAVLHALALQYEPAADEPPRASFDRAAVEAIVRPDGGRLNPWVYGRVAAACGVEPEAVRRALFVR
jgi:hypothetical protein